MFRWVLFSVAVVVAYAPLLWEHGRHLWTREYFQFFPVYLIAVAFVLRERLAQAELPPRGKWRIEPVSLGLAIPLLGIAYWVWSPWIAAVSFVLLGDSLLCSSCQSRSIWRLLALLIPLPLGLDAELVHRLQSLSSVQASQVLDFLHIPHVMQGNVLELNDKRLFVEEACSGINSVYMLTAATLFYVVVSGNRLIRSLPLLISVAWWALLANVFRIVSIAVAHQNYQADLSSGWRHEAIGLLSTILALVGIFSTKALLDFLTASVADERSFDFSTSQTLSPTVLWDVLTTSKRSLVYGTERARFTLMVSAGKLLPGLATILILLGVTHWSMLTIAEMRPAEMMSQPLAKLQISASQRERFLTLSEKTFESVSGFQTRDFQERNGEHADQQSPVGSLAKSWHFQAPAVSGTVTISGPYRNWQDLALHDEHQEAIVDHTSIQQLPGHRPQDRVAIVNLIHSSGERSNRYLCAFYPSGELVVPPRSFSDGDVTARIQGRLNDFATADEDTALWKIQLVTRQSTGLSMDSERQAERQLFAEVVAVLQRHWKLR